jgi:peptidoglycan/LPS O-acetylase OafA/YrhL
VLEATRARLRRRRGRLAVVCAVALLGATVATAHSSVAGDHMGEAAAICLAIVAGSAAVAALPALAGPVRRLRAPLQLGGRGAPRRLKHTVPHLPRGDPALLQVFRR